MSQINENEIKKRFEQISEFKINPEVTARDLEKTKQSLTKLTSESQQSGYNIWSIIMKSKLTKLTTAAVIIIAIAAGISRFGFKVQMTSPAIAQIIDNTRKMPWMHAVLEGTASPGQSSERLEAWVAFESGIYASTSPSVIGFLQGNMKQEYNPASQTITISYYSNDTLQKMGSIVAYWERMMKMFSDAEAQIIKEKVQYHGRKAISYNVNVSLGGQPLEISMIIDTEKELPVFLNQKVLDTDGQVLTEINGYFDYPDKGPSSIYDLGVPQDAKVIDKTQSENQ
ncbi:MAG: hypothetical protein JW787_06645 [Sedimentisphaerales bacterium]|nr:hypothetical protein [Sedimentisphaerales bacterium]